MSNELFDTAVTCLTQDEFMAWLCYAYGRMQDRQTERDNIALRDRIKALIKARETRKSR